MDTAIQTTYASSRRNVAGHYAHTVWHLLGAAVAVVAGFSTLNMTLADSGFAMLQEHAGGVRQKSSTQRDGDTENE